MEDYMINNKDLNVELVYRAYNNDLLWFCGFFSCPQWALRVMSNREVGIFDELKGKI